MVIGISSTFCGQSLSQVDIMEQRCTTESPRVAPVRELRSHQGWTDKVSERLWGRSWANTFNVIWISSSSSAWGASPDDPSTGSDGTHTGNGVVVNAGETAVHEKSWKVQILTVPDILSSSLMASWIAASKWLFSFPGLSDNIYIIYF